MNIKNTERDLKNSKEINLLGELYKHKMNLAPAMGHKWDLHQAVTATRQSLSRILYYNELYQKIINTPGVICEFGVQWGSTLSLLINYRGIYEPYNSNRVIYGFDTFSGFPDVSKEDGGFSKIGDYSTLDNYEEILENILSLHENNQPVNHIKKFELIKGDATVTIDKWLEDNPHAIISMAIFDMDIYVPTKNVLKKILPRLIKGSLLVFDELNCKTFPGETMALDEVLGLNNCKLMRHPHQVHCAYMQF